MSRQLEQKREDAQKRKDSRLLLALEGGLSEAVSRAGGELLGFSARLSPDDCLLTLRATLAGRRQISYVGGNSLGDCLLKAVREGKSDKLRWKADKYEKQSS